MYVYIIKYIHPDIGIFIQNENKWMLNGILILNGKYNGLYR